MASLKSCSDEVAFNIPLCVIVRKQVYLRNTGSPTKDISR